MAAAVLACAVVVVSVRFGVFVAAGADSYGYVSQAHLWARGQLRVSQPFARELPASVDDEVLAPLGYRPARVVGLPGGIVPTYSPGLPMLMALFRRAAGEGAVFYVVPLLAGASIWLVFVLGKRLSGPGAGLFAAALLASSPAFLASALRPMSDLPVAFWWTLALISAASSGPWTAATAGLATTAAVLTRPNLLLVALPIALPLLWDALRRRGVERRRLAIYAATASLGPLLVAAINAHLYGSPLRSGYGAIEDIYSLQHVWTNLERYASWFRETQTALPLLGLLAPFVAGGTAANAPERAGWSRTRLAWAALAVTVLTFASYVAYMPFDEWMYLRFLLPAYFTLFALFGVLLVRASSALPSKAGAAALLVLLAIGMAHYGVRQSESRDLFRWHDDDRRYVLMGRYARDHLPKDAVVFAMQHSGSLRYYSGRVTLRYDFVEPDQLDGLVTDLSGKGFPIYFLVERWEVERFRERFGDHSQWGRLEWTPMVATATATPVYLYDPRQREAPLQEAEILQ